MSMSKLKKLQALADQLGGKGQVFIKKTVESECYIYEGSRGGVTAKSAKELRKVLKKEVDEAKKEQAREDKEADLVTREIAGLIASGARGVNLLESIKKKVEPYDDDIPF